MTGEFEVPDFNFDELCKFAVSVGEQLESARIYEQNRSQKSPRNAING